MKQDNRDPFEAALHRARELAYPLGEFVGQESFMRASEIIALARQARIGPSAAVVDLCCGVAGPGALITRTLDCAYLGVDLSASAIEIARRRASGLGCRFTTSRIPPVPPGRFDVALLLETMLAFPDKESLVRSIRAALVPGGRFAFTLEEGAPLTVAERAQMPDADTVWLTPLDQMLGWLTASGLEVTHLDECSAAHRTMADALADAYASQSVSITADVGSRALDDLVSAHRLWSSWLASGRVRKFAVVAQVNGGNRPPRGWSPR
jgi:SAM-dependent methyltransferase